MLPLWQGAITFVPFCCDKRVLTGRLSIGCSILVHRRITILAIAYTLPHIVYTNRRRLSMKLEHNSTACSLTQL